MIQGHKPSGHVVTYDLSGKKIEQEMRQCAHCQFTWIYVPGSGAKRGYCFKCNGLLCGSKRCFEASLRGCAPFQDVVLEDDKRYELTGGIFVRKD